MALNSSLLDQDDPSSETIAKLREAVGKRRRIRPWDDIPDSGTTREQTALDSRTNSARLRNKQRSTREQKRSAKCGRRTFRRSEVFREVRSSFARSATCLISRC